MDGSAIQGVAVAKRQGELSKRQVAAVVVGNSLEVYDFITYGYFAVYIGQAFFPSSNPTSSLLASLATFGAGFLTRPIGALIIGRFADRVGRKPAMLGSFLLMGLANLGMALTPSYQAIGVAASFLVVGFRMLQGFALGGEVGPSVTYLFESAPPRQRGLYVSFQYMGAGVAALAGGLVGVGLASIMDGDGLRDYGWRVAMLLGAAVIPIGLALRKTLEETLHDAEHGVTRADQDPRAGRYIRVAFLGLIIMSAGSTSSYILSYLATYSIATLGVAPQVAFGGAAIGGLVGVTMSPLGGWLSDRFGRKPVMVAAWVVMFVAILPAFYLIAHFRTAAAVYGATVVIGSAGSLGATAVLIGVVEALPKRVRAGGIALVYALAVSIFGGSAQFNVAWLTSVTANVYAPAWYMMVFVGVGVIAMLNMPKSSMQYD